jgi:hypothetical protein
MGLSLYARCPGDENAGIKTTAWAVEDIGTLDSDEHREDVRHAFQAAFKLMTNARVEVTFSDEYPEPVPEPTPTDSPEPGG